MRCSKSSKIRRLDILKYFNDALIESSSNIFFPIVYDYLNTWSKLHNQWYNNCYSQVSCCFSAKFPSLWCPTNSSLFRVCKPPVSVSSAQHDSYARTGLPLCADNQKGPLGKKLTILGCISFIFLMLGIIAL